MAVMQNRFRCSSKTHFTKPAEFYFKTVKEQKGQKSLKRMRIYNWIEWNCKILLEEFILRMKMDIHFESIYNVFVCTERYAVLQGGFISAPTSLVNVEEVRGFKVCSPRKNFSRLLRNSPIWGFHSHRVMKRKCFFYFLFGGCPPGIRDFTRWLKCT